MEEERDMWAGRWRNERGSELRLDHPQTSTEGLHLSIGGSYRSAVGRVAAASEFPLTGWVAGTRIAFTVSFRERRETEPVDSLATWCGHLERLAGGRTVLSTLWHLSRAPADDDPERRRGWGEILTGASRFEKLPIDS